MKTAVRKLLEHYYAHHDMDRPLLQWIGVVGCIAFPVFYLLSRLTADHAYDDLPLRAVAATLCLGLALRVFWPHKLKPFYIGYSWLVVFYCLAFFLSFTMLRNHGGTAFVVNMVIGSVLIILLSDWRNAVTMLLLGYVSAVALAWLTDPAPFMSREFVFAAAGSLLLVVGGALSHQGQKRVEINRIRRLYSSLAGSIAHEMRNPLAQVRHVLDTVSETLSPGGAATGQSPDPDQMAAALVALQQGRQAVAHGLQSIELTLRQLHPEPLAGVSLLPVSALDCVRQAVEAFAYDDAGQRDRVRWVDAGDFHFRGDPHVLGLVLFNLLKNALHYVPLNPAMSVTLTVVATPSPSIVVYDTGPGILPQLVPRLFQEFQTAGKANGTGLGLAFCRRVMRALGGDIDCRSERGHFTEFTLSFPPEPVGEVPQPAAIAPTLTGRTVLVVDDQPLNRAIAMQLGREFGLAMLEADSGEMALDLLRAGTVPDAILMDINMPGLDGLATVRLLRQLPGAAGRVRVVALTANDSASMEKAVRLVGMQGLIGKPLAAATLGRALYTLLQGVPPAGPMRSQPAPDADAAQLETSRIADLQRLGLLDQLPGALLELRGLLQALAQAESRADRAGALAALHAMVGLSGDIGARAMHAGVRQHYDTLLRLPGMGEPVAARLSELLRITEQALWQGYRLRVPEADGDPSSGAHRTS